MANVRLVMEVTNGLADLSKEVPGLVLRKNPFGSLDFDVLIKAYSADKFLD